jgi:hypothetical protein
MGSHVGQTGTFPDCAPGILDVDERDVIICLPSTSDHEPLGIRLATLGPAVAV